MVPCVWQFFADTWVSPIPRSICWMITCFRSCRRKTCLPGRGPVPVSKSSVAARIEPEIADKVTEAVEWAVETGLIDMYGLTSGRSGEFLDRLTDLLTRNQVALLPAEPLCFGDEEGWGTPVSKKLQDQIWREYSHLVGKQEPANEAP